LIEARGVFFDRHRIKLMRPLASLLAGRPARERKILGAVFAELDAEWKWLTVDAAMTAARLSMKTADLRALISDLEAAGDIALKKSNWRQAYFLKKEPENLRELAERMGAGFREKEAADLARLEKVLALSSTKVCLTKTLLKHFGEAMDEPCGHCDRCRGIPPTKLKATKPRKVTEGELLEIRGLVDEKHAALGTPRQMARFLCGMSSPATMRARLYRHDGYGRLCDLPFAEVEAVAESFFRTA
jgi:ATP-dependent DNA helicase RecQ